MKNTLAASLLALSLFAACSGGASNVPGVYEIDKVALKNAMLAEMPAEAKGQPDATKMMDAFVNGMNITIELRADKTATMSMKGAMAGMPLDNSTTGTWSLDGSKLTIKTKEKDGKEETKVADYANGTFSVENDMSGKKMKMTFKKK